jgi:hypothetical protein
MTVKVVEVTEAQKIAAQLSIKIREQRGEPVREWTRRVAAARRRPETVDPDVDASDEVILYLV